MLIEVKVYKGNILELDKSDFDLFVKERNLRYFTSRSVEYILIDDFKTLYIVKESLNTDNSITYCILDIILNYSIETQIANYPTIEAVRQELNNIAKNL